MTGIRQRFLRVPLLFGALGFGAPAAVLAQQGAVGGQVVDASGGAPLEAARVILTGPNRIESTNRDGRFLFREVAPGSYQVRVLRVGYKPDTATASVTSGE